MVSIYVLLYVLIGGTQTAWGPLVGATFFTLLPEILRTALPAISKAMSALGGAGGQVAAPADSWRFVILGVFTIVMMLLRPEGIVTRTMLAKLRPSRHALPAGGGE
jgi:branched-chain amino acid transport system permease protein